MPVLVDPHGREMRGRLQPTKHLALGDERPKIDNAFESVVECDLERAVNDRLCENDMRQRLHSTGSTFSWAMAAAKRASRTSRRAAAYFNTLARFGAGSEPCEIDAEAMSTTARCSAMSA